MRGAAAEGRETAAPEVVLAPPRRRPDPWLVSILFVSFVLCVDHLHWGLPNGNESWAADAIGPLTFLNVGMRQLGEWNSGWFWFKYPFGYPLVVLVAYAPYLAFQILTGGLRQPVSEYPYGFADPEAALFHLAIIGRLVNVAFIVGTVALTYGIGRRLLGRRTGLLAAWFAATAYPFVYYAHTTNQDAAYLFWLTLALWATVACIDKGDRRAYGTLGVAAGMAMATKEQGFAFLLALPFVLIFGRQVEGLADGGRWRRGLAAAWNRNTRRGLALALATWAVAGNALMNPTGFILRLQDLSGTPVPGLSSRVTPVEFSLFKGFAKEWAYVTGFVDVIVSTFGVPLFGIAIAGMVYLLRYRRRAALCLLVPLVLYFTLSLRTHHVLTLRYTLPVLPIFAIAAAALCIEALRLRLRAGVVGVVVLGLLSLSRAMEVNKLMRYDPRYEAEQWMSAYVEAGSTVETYQKPVYLPRMPDLNAAEIPIAERSVEALRQRAPEFIVLSSASRKTIHHFWSPDWRASDGELLTEVPEATAMLEALEAGELPFELVARFRTYPRMINLRITSLAPEIRVFARVAAVPADAAEDEEPPTEPEGAQS